MPRNSTLQHTSTWKDKKKDDDALDQWKKKEDVKTVVWLQIMRDFGLRTGQCLDNFVRDLRATVLRGQGGDRWRRQRQLDSILGPRHLVLGTSVDPYVGLVKARDTWTWWKFDE